MRRPTDGGHPMRSKIICGAKVGALMALASLGLGGCADVAALRTPATVVGLATKPKEGPDFVKQSRPENTEFTSVGVETAKPPDNPRDAAGVKQLQAELEAQRAAGHALLEKMSPSQPAATASADPKAKGAVPDGKAQAPKKKTDEAKKQDKQAPNSAQTPQ
jgi:hypothetical protein